MEANQHPTPHIEALLQIDQDMQNVDTRRGSDKLLQMWSLVKSVGKFSLHPVVGTRQFLDDMSAGIGLE